MGYGEAPLDKLSLDLMLDKFYIGPGLIVIRDDAPVVHRKHALHEVLLDHAGVVNETEGRTLQRQDWQKH